MLKYLCIASLLFLSLSSKAQTPTLFQNLYAGNGTNTGVSNLYFSTIFNGKLYFNVRDTSGSYDIYCTDGTVAGTTFLKRIPQVANFQAFNNVVYFGYVDVPNGGSQLWKTDGTASGTQLVKTFGGNSIAPNSFIVFDSKLYFVADTATTLQRRRLFISDGTATGTYILEPSLYETGYDYGIINNKLVFSASSVLDSPMKKEPYTTDGTTSGTTLLKDINPGPAGSNPSGYVLYNGNLFFVATTVTQGIELWMTDGTNSGTNLLTDLNAGTANGISSTLNACVYNNKLYFAGNDGTTGIELFSTDGTASGTALVKDIKTGTGGSSVSALIKVGNKLLFTCNDGTNGFEVWSSDGTATGTAILKDINSGSNSGVYTMSSANLLCPDRLYFDGDDGNYNIEPWVTDGTASGTVKLGEINTTTLIPGSLDYETIYKKMGDKVYLAAYEPTNGREIYTVTDTCDATGTPTIADPVKAGVKLLPNPASSLINIQATFELKEILLLDITGRVVSKFAANGRNMSIDIHDIESGVYLLRINNQETVRFVKQ